jgi:catechol 2,3-dioxygenase-like lactoylglutathione lyase family enzyme
LRLAHITFACDDARAVAEFWAAVLGYEVVPSDADCVARG